MEFIRTEVAGVFVVVADALTDERGVFARTFDAAEFGAAGLPTVWPQCNTSSNRRRGTLRGMHFQAEPRPDTKLVRCTRGRIFDVVVDVRRESQTCGSWFGVELSHDRRNALFIPAGCAHGFITLVDDCEIFYMMGEIYVPELARGVRWNDTAFGIKWPFEPVVMSERDASYPDFQP